jgi:hypothetical protein
VPSNSATTHTADAILSVCQCPLAKVSIISSWREGSECLTDTQNQMQHLEKEISSSSQNNDAEQMQNKQDSSWPRRKRDRAFDNLKTNDEWKASRSVLQRSLPRSGRGIQVYSSSRTGKSWPATQKLSPKSCPSGELEPGGQKRFRKSRA